MELLLKNIGPISEINININSDLTFVYGKNNIGKSYAITLMYLFFKNYVFEGRMNSNRFFNYYHHSDAFITEYRKDNLKILTEKINESSKNLDISKDVKKYAAGLIATYFLNGFEDSLKSSFGDISNLNNKISNMAFEIIIKTTSFDLRIYEQESHLKLDFISNKTYLCRKVNRHLFPRPESNNIILYYNDESQFFSDLNAHIASLYRNSLIEILQHNSNVYFLPASRSGLYRALNAFSQILAELAKKRSFLQQKIVLPSISEQDSDYFSMINEINIKRTSLKYSAIAEKIERDLLKGSVSFDQKTKQILFHPNNSDIAMELLGTSSMIAEVSPIVLYLRYIIASDEDIRKRKSIIGKPVIFIEEPEAHLHPEAQTELIECFISLIKAGAKLVITSHSNYIFSKLNNLIAENKIGQSEIQGYHFYSTETGSNAKILNISKLGLEDINFIEVAERLYDEKLQIIEKME